MSAASALTFAASLDAGCRAVARRAPSRDAAPPRPRVLAKRSAKKRQSRKLEKREDVREGQKLMEERRAAAAAAAAHRPEPPPPPSDVADAAARVATRAAAFDAALETVGDRKREARESDAWDPARGYKPFDGVQDAVAALRDAKTAAHEAHLERAVALLCQAKGEPPASLDRFDWTYERGVDAKNARCLSFLLAALCKANVASGMAEVLFVAVDCEVLHTIDEKVVAKALATLEDLNDLGLLDEGEPEILEAARRSLRPAETS